MMTIFPRPTPSLGFETTYRPILCDLNLSYETLVEIFKRQNIWPRPCFLFLFDSARE